MIVKVAKIKSAEFVPVIITLETQQELDDFTVHIQVTKEEHIEPMVEQSEVNRIYLLGVRIYRKLVFELNN